MRILVKLLEQKLELAKDDSDFTFFFNLLVLGEALIKLHVLVCATNVVHSSDRHQYRILYNLVRANGIGEWSKALDDLLVGTASQYIATEFRSYQSEITKKYRDQEWQKTAVEDLWKAMSCIGINTPPLPNKVDLKSWFKLFTELRNKTRGHGAITGNEKTTEAAAYLDRSLKSIIYNSELLRIPSAVIKRNLSGKYRVTLLGQGSESFESLKTNKDKALRDGVYIDLNGLKKVPLISCNIDASDFFIANGGFSSNNYEMLSYYSDNTNLTDSSEYLAPTGVLPPSESDGLGELIPKGNCFTNLPALNYSYIERTELENELFSLLKDDRRTIVTLLGRGGIGKTSLALKVVPRLYKEHNFEAVIWFSSRDIDLKETGAKLVSASVLSTKDISKYYCELVLSKEQYQNKNLDYISYFQSQLTKSDIGPTLFIFDNFETTDSPIEVFKWVDTYIRYPNKVLITTRLREFIGDFPLNVHGMNKDESYKLIELTAQGLGVESHITESLKEQIFSVSSGHPYIIKIMMGELSKRSMKGALPKIVAGKDDILTALFERTYSALTPSTQRIFLTLASWNSAVPRIALEATIMNSFDNSHEIEEAIDTLIQYSLVEEHQSKIDQQYFIILPYAAYAFGQKKLKVSPIRNLISPDVKFIQRFGVEKLENENFCFDTHLISFFGSLTNHENDFKEFKEIIECISYSYNPSWILAAEWLEESNDRKLFEDAKRFLTLYLEREYSAKSEEKLRVWNSLARLSNKLNNPFDEIHAYAEASQIDEINFNELSTMVNKVNHLLTKPDLDIDKPEVKKELLSELYNKVFDSLSKANATDCSRIAWLALHLDKKTDAKAIVTTGLAIDPSNIYLLKLENKLNSSHRTPQVPIA
ncbi:NB-ARC domain-containing protein [Vibrio brasiliensis]|uniref:NB-ARC domain-containing protein n=1 Tax=Vibrio brasiliensis LMG 20546 TaxID=945543 RepID=E8LYR3_9VIBR|nr:NB-ARC domain-containing protein [Vibrio brasiliensis]EGA64177.1 hypothetical protein VIBR0546_02534 [Vibrio brasiliensis LMG 20546]